MYGSPAYRVVDDAESSIFTGRLRAKVLTPTCTCSLAVSGLGDGTEPFVPYTRLSHKSDPSQEWTPAESAARGKLCPLEQPPLYAFW